MKFKSFTISTSKVSELFLKYMISTIVVFMLFNYVFELINIQKTIHIFIFSLIFSLVILLVRVIIQVIMVKVYLKVILQIVQKNVEVPIYWMMIPSIIDYIIDVISLSLLFVAFRSILTIDAFWVILIIAIFLRIINGIIPKIVLLFKHRNRSEVN
ncbi:MAG: hypothetical protein WC123_04285 [Bacilli bacterium]